MEKKDARAMVSVIVPVYKSENTLERCVKSITMQSYREIEILLVVDGPPDQSGILADRLAGEDSRIRVLYQKNQGVSAARNRGLKEAAGKYIRFVDSDDFLQETSIEILVEAMEQNETDFVIGGFHHLYFGHTIEKLPGKEGTFSIADNREYVLKLYREGFLNMPWNKLFKRKLIKEGFLQQLNLGEDLLFNLAYLKECQHFTTVRRPVCEFIQDDRGTTLSTRRRDDKLELTLMLYEKVTEAFFRIYKDKENAYVLENKLFVEFLDDLEQLAFYSFISQKEKFEIIEAYREAMKRIRSQHPAFHPDLGLLDYKIIYFFLRAGSRHATYALIVLRGLLVKLLKRR